MNGAYINLLIYIAIIFYGDSVASRWNPSWSGFRV